MKGALSAIVICLLAGNLTYFGYQWFSTSQNQENTQTPADAQTTKQIQLLNELDEAQLQALAPNPEIEANPAQDQLLTSTPDTPAPEPPEIEAAAIDVISCHSLGPFDNIKDAQKIGIDLDVENIPSQQRVGGKKIYKGLWFVYLPPMSSISEARDKFNELKKKGVNDLFIIGEGEQENAISLGMFRSKVLAERRAEALVNKGYEPHLEPYYQTIPQYWLDYQLVNASFPEKKWQQLQKRFPDIEQIERVCE